MKNRMEQLVKMVEQSALSVAERRHLQSWVSNWSPLRIATISDV